MVEFDGLEEPVPCDGCGRWVELQACRSCRRCRSLLCGRCLKGFPDDTRSLCTRCRPENAND